MPEIYLDVDVALSEVPVNIAALVDDTDFKSREQSVTYDQAGMDLLWNFVTTAGAYTQTAVTPTTAGDYDWTNEGNGMYAIEIPASGGASINNATEGFGWFSGFATGILPWRGPIIGFRAAGLNNVLIDDAYSATRGLTGTALPAVAADGVGGLPISDAGGLDLDTLLGRITANVALASVCTEVRLAELAAANIPTDINDIQSRLPAALVSGRMASDVIAISGDTVAADNLELQYDTTGLTGDTFPSTQLQASNIVATGSTGKEPARLSPDGFVITLGENEVNTEDATRPLDGTTHDIEAQLSGTEQIDVYYEFQIGAGTPSLVTWHGMLDKGGGAAKNITVQARDVDAATWRTIGSIVSGTSIISQTFDLFVSEIGTGANAGIVRIRFVTGSVAFTSTTKLQTDQIFITHGLGAEGYELGAIWFDSNANNTGTTKGIDGTATNPVSTMAAVNTLLAKTNLHRVEVASGSTVTLGAAQNDQTFDGVNWTLALAGQDIAGTTFIGATVSGIAAGTGTTQQFINCLMGATSHIKGTHIMTCGIAGTQTVVEAGDFFFDRCHSAIAGTATWIFEFGDAIGNTNLNVRNYSGGIQLESMGVTGTDTASIEGQGQIVEGTCTGGTVAVRGPFTISGETNLTFSENARMEIDNIAVASVDNWETQSQADPTGFHVNVLEIGGTAQTANDNGADINAILLDTADIQPLVEKMAYVGPDGLGVWIDDGAANTNTVLGTDGTPDNPVSTIAAATTVATALGSQRFYLVNDTVITLAQTYEGYEFVGIGVSNQVTLGSQDVDNTLFRNVILTGTQGGTQFMRAIDCQLQAILSAEILADFCWLTGDITLRAATNHSFGHCKSGVPGNDTPDLTFPGAGTSSVNFRHYSGGLTIKSATSLDTVSYETDGQIIIDATCTSLNLTVRGNCTITDNGTTTALTQDAAVNRTSINAEVVDVMATDVQTLPGQAAPPNGPTYQEIWTWLYKAWRNKKESTSTGISLFNDAGAVVDSKILHNDDGTTYQKNEVVTGP